LSEVLVILLVNSVSNLVSMMIVKATCAAFSNLFFHNNIVCWDVMLVIW